VKIVSAKAETWDVDCEACGDTVTVTASAALLAAPISATLNVLPAGWAYLPVIGGGRGFYCPPCAEGHERN
jgi:hypothetical protein